MWFCNVHAYTSIVNLYIVGILYGGDANRVSDATFYDKSFLWKTRR